MGGRARLVGAAGLASVLALVAQQAFAEDTRTHVLAFLNSITATNTRPANNPPFCNEILDGLRHDPAVTFLDPIVVTPNLSDVAVTGELRACPAIDLRESRAGLPITQPLRHDRTYDSYSLFAEPADDGTHQDWYVLFGHRAYRGRDGDAVQQVFDYAALIDPADCWVIEQYLRTAQAFTTAKFVDERKTPFIAKAGRFYYAGLVSAPATQGDGVVALDTLLFEEQNGPHARRVCSFVWNPKQK